MPDPGCSGIPAYVKADGYISSATIANAQGRIIITGVNATSVTIFSNDAGGEVCTTPYDCMSVAPIKLKKFAGKDIHDCRAALSWETETESNVKDIEVQQSVEGNIFKTVASVLPKGGNSQYMIETDNSLNPYFRLKINDLDGSFEYSEILKLNTSCSNTIYQLNSNPSHNSIKLKGLTKMTKYSYWI